jgi:hypothetical protein
MNEAARHLIEFIQGPRAALLMLHERKESQQAGTQLRQRTLVSFVGEHRAQYTRDVP